MARPVLARSPLCQNGRRPRAPADSQGGVLQRRQQVVAIQRGVVGDDLVDRHAGGEQLQQVLDRVARLRIVGLPWQIEGSVVMRSRRVRGATIWDL